MTPIITTSASGRKRLKPACLDYVTEDGSIRADANCEFQIRLGPSGEANGLPWWGWDGNEASPTISPSIQCERCGLHVTVTKGKESGRPRAFTMRNYSRDGNVIEPQ